MSARAILACPAFLLACAAQPASPDAAPGALTFTVGLQEDGAIAFERVAVAAKLPVTPVRVDVSAPIWPDVLVMYTGEGASYPKTAAGQAELVDSSALTFDKLLHECRASYPDITLPANGQHLSADQIATNYNEVARCAYEKYTAKPYWIPQLVADVDICARALNPSWRLLTAADIAGFSPKELQFLKDTLTATAAKADFFGEFYYSLDVYASGNDRTLVKGSLEPASPGVAPLPATVDGSSTSHLEAGLALRCIKP
jgi:hypothetical protein